MKKVISIGVLMAAALSAGDKVRVFIADSNSWEQVGRAGGARNQTPELFKTFSDKCGAGVTLTMNKDNADYIVTFSHEGGKGWARRDNKIAVFNKAGDMVHSDSAVTLGGAVGSACKAILSN